MLHVMIYGLEAEQLSSFSHSRFVAEYVLERPERGIARPLDHGHALEGGRHVLAHMDTRVRFEILADDGQSTHERRSASLNLSRFLTVFASSGDGKDAFAGGRHQLLVDQSRVNIQEAYVGERDPRVHEGELVKDPSPLCVVCEVASARQEHELSDPEFHYPVGLCGDNIQLPPGVTRQSAAVHLPQALRRDRRPNVVGH